MRTDPPQKHAVLLGSRDPPLKKITTQRSAAYLNPKIKINQRMALSLQTHFAAHYLVE
jgi:hypothetical protein